ncbi:hypothetical protein [Mucilaginibacter lacusdianchii]|uniref:hypothetical protein n=1 Tax=Mucilaginibacter lacusdianchii TaxID=2684211 RepID=UPI00131B1A44|nr:hypothetical protein [Mucilaginibacter sp. JXJ CY 39]
MSIKLRISSSPIRDPYWHHSLGLCRIRVSFILILVFSFFFTYAQNTNTSIISKIDYKPPIGPSPEAAALGQFGKVPVSLFRGTPQITVPMYSFRYGDIQIPISLNYNASGVRVDDIASSVGLGWSMLAGGVISRTVRGGPDEQGMMDDLRDGFNANGVFIVNSGTITPDYDLALDATLFNRNYERDTYTFNFLNFSGRFVIGRNGTAFFPATPNLKLSILDDNITRGFLFTDDKGFQYYFKALEGSTSNEICSVGPAKTPDGSVITAWYLTRIVSPQHFEVVLEYDIYDYTLPKNYAEAKYVLLNPGAGCDDDLARLSRKCKTIESYSAQRLKRIYAVSDNKEVIFNYSVGTRQDMTYDGQAQGKSLESIQVRGNGNLLKKWQLAYNYFSPASINKKRLKLVAVKEDDKPPYEFTYEETKELPERLSLAQDHWGYYNGKDVNTSFIPAIPRIGIPSGADREPDEAFMKAGSLKRVKYPTGGFTEFEFEPHTNLTTDSTISFVQESASLNAAANTGDFQPELNFFLPANATDVYLSCSLFPINFDDVLNGSLINNQNVVLKLISSDYGGNENNLSTGEQYKLKINRNNYADHGSISLFWKKPVINTSTGTRIIYGGLRVRSIKDYGKDNTLISAKYYNYNLLNDPGKSSGRVPKDSTKVYYSDYRTRNTFYNQVSDYIPCNYWALSSNSSTFIGDEADGVIGYTQVTETDEAGGLNGRTIYNYMSNIADQGLLKEKIEQRYDKQSKQFVNIHHLLNQYEADDLNASTPPGPAQQVIPNWHITMVQPQQDFYPGGMDGGTSPVGGTLPTTYAAKFELIKYLYVSALNKLVKTTETTFSNTGQAPVEVVTDFAYGSTSHTYPTTILKKDSQGRLLKIDNKYVTDIAETSNAQPIYTTMRTANIIAPLIERKVVNQSNNNKELSYVKNNYTDWGNQVFQPSSTETGYNGQPPVAEVTYTSYDSHGNPLQVKVKSGPPVAYLWGYNSQYPVAEIRNATYQQVLGVLGQAKIDQLAGSNPGDDASVRNLLAPLRTALPQSLVSIYTYSPLVGMTSQTDAKGETTYYEYDNSQRMKFIKDSKGNIMKQMTYHYQNQ